MNDCTCTEPGYCTRHAREVTATGLRVCRGGDARSIAAYFGGGGQRRRGADGATEAVVATPATGPDRSAPCVYLGAAVEGEDGRQATRDCGTCRGTVRLKVFACLHPGHAADPTTTAKECTRCRDYARELPALETAGGDAEMNYWRGGA